MVFSLHVWILSRKPIVSGDLLPRHFALSLSLYFLIVPFFAASLVWLNPILAFYLFSFLAEFQLTTFFKALMHYLYLSVLFDQFLTEECP